jgi:hypothetical protein
MKKMYFKTLSTVFTVLIVLMQLFSYAQEKTKGELYHEKMKSSLYTLYKAGNYQTFKMMSNQLRKIADEEKTKWIPYYHAAYAHIMAAFLSKEKFEAEEFLNNGQEMIDNANKYSPNNSEIVALQGFLYQARIIVNPEARSQEYLHKAVKEYDQARFMNPENPRPYYLIGQILYRIPKQLGGNKENACAHFQRARDKYKSFKPRSEFSPNWGEEANQLLLDKCKSN